MAESKSTALPLGYAPRTSVFSFSCFVLCQQQSISTAPQPVLPHRPSPSRKDRARKDRGWADSAPRALALPAREFYTGASAGHRSVAQPGSAPRSGRGGRRFESCHSDQSVSRPDFIFARPRQAKCLSRHKPPGILRDQEHMEQPTGRNGIDRNLAGCAVFLVPSPPERTGKEG
jgi:hypothetical protein